jgi:uncharacterized protein (DUF1499 family)
MMIACTQKENNVVSSQANNDTIREIKKNFQLDNEENAEIKYRMMDSLHYSYIDRITSYKRYLKYYSHPVQGNLESLRVKDSLIFQFTKEGKVIENNLGYIGDWGLHFHAFSDSLATRSMMLDIKNRFLKDSIFNLKYYKFWFENNDTLLGVNGLSKEDIGVIYYKFMIVE